MHCTCSAHAMQMAMEGASPPCVYPESIWPPGRTDSVRVSSSPASAPLRSKTGVAVLLSSAHAAFVGVLHESMTMTRTACCHFATTPAGWNACRHFQLTPVNPTVVCPPKLARVYSVTS
jgi:hypothetical protein